MKTLSTCLLSVFLIFISFSAYSQRHIVSGTVSDEISLLPLQQISVVDNVSGTATITNADGHFSLFLSRGEIHLEYSGTGYDASKHSFILNKDTVIDVRLASIHYEKGRRIKKDSYRNAPLSSVSSDSSLPGK
jgi:hypothetical protein